MDIKKIKVLFLIPNLAHGGAEKVLVNLANNINKEKFDVTIQTLFDVGVNRQYLNKDVHYIGGFKRMPRGNSHIMKLFSPQKLYSYLIKDKYDIIVSYLEGPTARIVSGCTNPDTKLVSWIHCRISNEKEAEVGFRNFEEAKKCYNKFDYTACVSKMTMDYFTDTFDFKKTIGVIYNTIETDKIIKLSLEKIDDVEFDESYINICSVGKLTKLKGFDRLLHIHKKLNSLNLKNKFYILGIGEEEKNLKKYISENKLEDTFILLGYRTNPYKYVKKCDLYVCSSHSEGFSTSVTESLIVGTPVVTTLCSGMQEMLGYNNEYGIVTENNEDALYEGIEKILTEENLLQHYKEQAKVRGQRFSTEKTVKAVENMLESL